MSTKTATKVIMPAKTRKTAAMLATIMALRMLGLFIILPIFALYVNHYHGTTPQLIGLALGIYGFSRIKTKTAWTTLDLTQ